MYYLQKNGTFLFKSTDKNTREYITPLITDSHLHLLSLGFYLSCPSLRTKSLPEIKQIIESELENTEGPIILQEWHDDYASPDRHFIDSICRDRPILLGRYDGHTAVVNSAIIDQFEFSAQSDFVDLKKGILRERVKSEVFNTLVQNINTSNFGNIALEHLRSKGYGFIHSDDKVFDEDYHFDYNTLDLDIYPKIRINNINEIKDRFLAGSLSDYKAIKIMLDGTFGGHTAYISHEWADSTGCGKLLMLPEELMEIMIFCRDYGFHLCIHIIGDKGLDVFLKTSKPFKLDKYVRIIHADYIREDQLDEIKNRQDLILDCQPSFSVTDKELLKKRLAAKSRFTYRYADLYAHNIPMFFSSDAPVEYPDWLADVRTLQKAGLPLEYIFKQLLISPEMIDGFDRFNYSKGNYLKFTDNPFEKISKPQIFINNKLYNNNLK